jgi:hypothetical protein
MSWGKWIVLSFVMFALFIGTLVVICVKQDLNLVSGNYYQEELAYQQQIERLENANKLKQQPRMMIVGQDLEIQFDGFKSLDEGQVDLFRPSDTRFDKKFILQNSNGERQLFDISMLPKGMYHAKMKWSMNGKEYFVEQSITL